MKINKGSGYAPLQLYSEGDGTHNNSPVKIFTYGSGGSQDLIFRIQNWSGNYFFKYGATGGDYNAVKISRGGGGGNGPSSGYGIFDVYGENQDINLRFRGKGSSYFNAGNLGVGTNAPSHKLDVHGEIRWGGVNNSNWGDGLLTMNSGWNGGDYPTLGSLGADGRSLIMLHNPHIPYRTDNSASGYSGKAGIRMATDASTSSWWDMGLAGDFFYIYRKNSGEFFRITSSGKVGIGTTSPSEELEVNGTIRSKEVKVEASPWPDYVFNTDYQLPSLAETRAFIDANHHLPEVPSAADVEAKGIALGEMNAILLKKIEELTLHVINQNLQMEEQQQRLEKLEKLLAN
ncbi:hypothetical protein [Marinoscillum sp.]|uniref:hypothetical protein n=1 Tax=Marinoscillum sp. TaxID=2024838 RepID=UPI003BAB4084